jgi:uncharacterized protein (TIGR00255 family)
MIKSMTAFAQTDFSLNGVGGLILIRTYNSRFLDLSLRIGQVWASLEDRLKSSIAARIARGRVEVSIQFASPEKFKSGALVLNLPLARNYWTLFTELKETLNLTGSIALGDFLSLKELIVFQEDPHSEEELWQTIAPALEKALSAVEMMRSAEGKNLARDLQSRIKSLQRGIEAIALRLPQMIEAYRTRLSLRIQKIAPEVECDSQRLAQEVALMADRSDISEELVRLGSHLKQCQTLFKEKKPVGKKMEFLLQEMNREVNTIGSKSLDSAITHQAISLKAELEKMREQVQNIE